MVAAGGAEVPMLVVHDDRFVASMLDATAVASLARVWPCDVGDPAGAPSGGASGPERYF